MQTNSIYIAYQDDRFLNFLSSINSSSKNHEYQFLGSTSNGLEALGYILTHRPEMVILENNLTHLTSIDIIRILIRKELKIKCIVIFSSLEEALSQESYFKHISGIILHTTNEAMFRKCLNEVSAGNTFIHPRIRLEKPSTRGGIRGTT